MLKSCRSAIMSEQLFVLIDQGSIRDVFPSWEIRHECNDDVIAYVIQHNRAPSHILVLIINPLRGQRSPLDE